MKTSVVQAPDRIAAILTSFVPYHHARWNCFGRNAAFETVVVEVGDLDSFRVLELQTPENLSYARKTLFPGVTPHSVPKASVRLATQAALEHIDPRIVVISGYSSSHSLAALEWCSRRQRVPAIVCTESNSFDQPRSRLTERVKARIVRQFSGALAGGRTHAEYLRELKFPVDRIALGYDAVDNSHFERGSRDARLCSAAIRKELHLPNKYFVCCGRFEPKKNHLRLIRAFGKFRKSIESKAPQSESWSLVIVGEGNERSAIARQIQDEGLGGAVVLLGARPYAVLPKIYGLASAFIHPSSTEQWGLVVNEAMACGLPVLVSQRCGCAAELIHEGDNGFLFNPLEEDEIAEAMLQIGLLHESQLHEMGERSRRIVSDWGPERFASGLSQAISYAISVGPKPGTMIDRWLLRFLALNRS